MFFHLLYDSLSDSLHLFFLSCPFSRCFTPMPKFWLLLLSIFHLFSLSPAGRQMGDLLLGTENVMERVSSHPTMRTGCSCDISLQIEGECSGVPNGTFLGLLYFHDILKSPPRSLWKDLDLSLFVFHTIATVTYQEFDLFSFFIFGRCIERQMWKKSWLVLFQYQPGVLKTRNVLSLEK